MWAARRATGTLKNCVARDWLATSSRSSVGIGCGTPASLVTISKCSRLHTDELSRNVFHPTQRTPARPPGAHLAQEAPMFLPLSHIFSSPTQGVTNVKKEDDPSMRESKQHQAARVHVCSFKRRREEARHEKKNTLPNVTVIV